MGLFGTLFGKRGDKSSSENVSPNQLNPREKIIQEKSMVIFDRFTVHPDLIDLIWILDGPRKNFENQPCNIAFEIDGISVYFGNIGNTEPSAISTKMPIKDVSDITKVPRPPYYPRYSELTPEQRGVYWKLLSNPYNPEIDIGFVFILYYGLERHLFSGNYEKAFDIIIKLRDVHKNPSFQNYSAHALILTSLKKQRADLILKFIQSIDHDFEANFSNDLFLLCKYGLNLPLSAKDIMRLAKTMGFEKNNYIKKYPDLFEETLSKNIQKIHNNKAIYIKNLIKDGNIKDIPTGQTFIFANMAINNKTVEIPQISGIDEVRIPIYELLSSTHEEVKQKLAEMRKTGELKPEPKESKEKKVIVFDGELENELLEECENNKKSIVDYHFSLYHLQEFYYKYRDLDNAFVEKSIDYCYRDIEILDKLQAGYQSEQKKRYQQSLKFRRNIDNEDETEEYYIFQGQIPAFKRLVTIYEKQKEYLKATEICDKAVEYYLKYKMEGRVEEWRERKEKLLKKIK